ncbi:hypothetical protein SFRURICE_014565 [Spodoptera frugiperda]|nr:hypothetical protein SFRURICE_014565 [Spodoptera frugiperda]
MCKNETSAKVLFGCFNTIFFACGFVEVISGFLLLCDSKRILLSRLLAAPDDDLLTHPPFYYLALGLLAAGLAMCATGALGCWATYMPSYAVLSILQCCGMTDARNYDMSIWQLRRLGPRGMSVPLSCCVQYEDNVSYLNPAPVNASRCQEVQANPAFRYVPGCLGPLEDWYQQQYLILMLGLFIVALFKLGVLLSTIFSCIRLKKRRQIMQAFSMRSLDNNTNENIYECKLSTVHEEPITAKYIQPNNFYSPRLRNPRIFDNKPNEVV